MSDVPFKIFKYQQGEVSKRLSIGDKYILIEGCPECGSDLEVTKGVCVMCTNWQHPNMPESHYEGGNRSCSYALMSG